MVLLPGAGADERDSAPGIVERAIAFACAGSTIFAWFGKDVESPKPSLPERYAFKLRGSTQKHGATGEGNWVHNNLLVANEVGVLVILGTPETLIEDNRIVAGDDSKAGIVLDDAPRSRVGDNIIESRGESGFTRIDDRRG